MLFRSICIVSRPCCGCLRALIPSRVENDGARESLTPRNLWIASPGVIGARLRSNRDFARLVASTPTNGNCRQNRNGCGGEPTIKWSKDLTDTMPWSRKACSRRSCGWVRLAKRFRQWLRAPRATLFADALKCGRASVIYDSELENQ